AVGRLHHFDPGPAAAHEGDLGVDDAAVAVHDLVARERLAVAADRRLKIVGEVADVMDPIEPDHLLPPHTPVPCRPTHRAILTHALRPRDHPGPGTPQLAGRARSHLPSTAAATAVAHRKGDPGCSHCPMPR